MRSRSFLRGVALLLTACASACASNDPAADTTPTPTAAAEAARAPTSTSTAAPRAVTAPQPTTPATSNQPRPSEPAQPTPEPGQASTTAAQPNQLGCVGALPLSWRAAQVLMPGIYDDTFDRDAAIVAELDIGNVIVMDWDAVGAGADRLTAFKSVNDVPLLIAVDEEGGDVQRLAELGALPSQQEAAATLTPAAAEALVAEHAEAVAGIGFDVVFAPVVDVADPTGLDPIGSRTFSADPLVVTEFARAYVQGWRQHGVLPVLKHFPGHGRASADSHNGRSATPPIDDLRSHDLVPYVAFQTTPIGVMVGHLDIPGLSDDGLPSSLSSAAIDGLLRNELGLYDALVFTDALGMNAVSATWSLPSAAVMALSAGADVVVYTDVDRSDAVRSAITAAVQLGDLAESRLNEAVERILRYKSVDPCGLTVES